jgi:hypothetical protein
MEAVRTFNVSVPTTQTVNDEVYTNDYASLCEARAGLSRYLAFYNHERPQQARTLQTPVEVNFQSSAGRCGVLKVPVT